MDREARAYVARRLRDLRLGLGVDRTRFARLMGVHRQIEWRYERGDRLPGVAALYRLAVALDLCWDDLLPPTDAPVDPDGPA